MKITPNLASVQFTGVEDTATEVAMLALKMGTDAKRNAEQERDAEERLQAAAEHNQLQAMQDKATAALVGGIASGTLSMVGGAMQVASASADPKALIRERQGRLSDAEKAQVVEKAETARGQCLTDAAKADVLAKASADKAARASVAGSSEVLGAEASTLQAGSKLIDGVSSGVQQYFDADAQRAEMQAHGASREVDRANDEVHGAQSLVDQSIEAAREVQNTANEVLLLTGRMA